MATKKILVLAGDYVEDYEIIVPFHALQMVGHTVHVVCVNRRSREANGDNADTTPQRYHRHSRNGCR